MLKVIDGKKVYIHESFEEMDASLKDLYETTGYDEPPPKDFMAKSRKAAEAAEKEAEAE